MNGYTNGLAVAITVWLALATIRQVLGILFDLGFLTIPY